jgi:PAS domain S-box-containing protein
MQFVNPAHQHQIIGGDRPGLVIHAAPADPDNLRLSAHRQVIVPVDHRFALGKSPALPSAPDKKSRSSVNSPILACSVLTSIAGGLESGFVSAPKTPAAPSRSCDLQVVICTAHSDYGWHDLQAKLGSSDRLLILKKPFDVIEVRQMAEALCAKWELLRRSRHHMEELEARVTERTQNLSQANQELRDQISERKQAEAALRESELRFRQLAENISEVFWVSSPSGEELFYVSPAYEQIWGWACQSIYEDPKQWFKNILEEDRPPVAKALSELSQGTNYDLEYRIRHPNGSTRWIRDRRSMWERRLDRLGDLLAESGVGE